MSTCTPRVQSKCYLKAVRIEGTSDVEDLVGEVYVYLVSGKYGDGGSRDKKRSPKVFGVE